MPFLSLRKWWNRVASRRAARSAKKVRHRKCFLEVLEERIQLTGNLYTVISASDLGSANGLGIRDTSDPTGHSGDLRYTIAQADQSANANSTITFASSLAGSTIVLNTTELQIAQSTTIIGLGARNLTVSGGNGGHLNSVRVFDVTNQNAVVTISGLTITNGNGSPANIGAAGDQGGDVFNSGNLTLTADVVSNGFVSGNAGGPDARGGAIFNANRATLVLNNTQVTGSEAVGVSQPAAVLAGNGFGGGVYNDATATLILEAGSQITNNIALGGSGVNGVNGVSGIGGVNGFTSQNPTPDGQPGANGGNAGSGSFRP